MYLNLHNFSRGIQISELDTKTRKREREYYVKEKKPNLNRRNLKLRRIFLIQFLIVRTCGEKRVLSFVKKRVSTRDTGIIFFEIEKEKLETSGWLV